ncbi:MAG: class I SAM-dependent DNA methyltransferase, partial [Legionellaceae bacterium]
HYSLPHSIGRALHQLQCTKVTHTIDLGCGTGLCGIVLRELSEQLTGIDISTKMLAQAKNKAIYDELIEAELISFLQKDTTPYDMAVAADVLPYLGELGPLFSGIHQRLNNQGLFIFTHEISTDDPWTLQDTSRFSHHPDYIHSLCSQYDFKILFQENIIARHQQNQELHVMLYVVQINPRNIDG